MVKMRILVYTSRTMEKEFKLCTTPFFTFSETYRKRLDYHRRKGNGRMDE
jgi:hypothetical protein